MGLVQQFSAYSSWRSAVSGHLLSLHNWLVENELGDAQSELRLQQLLERLREDKLIIAFVVVLLIPTGIISFYSLRTAASTLIQKIGAEELRTLDVVVMA